MTDTRTLDLADSIIVTGYDNSLDVTFNNGAVVTLCRAGETATFPAATVRLHFIGSDPWHADPRSWL
jgi:hypothetical protein